MKFLLSGHLPDDFAPSTQDESDGSDIHAFDAELEAVVALLMPPDCTR